MWGGRGTLEFRVHPPTINATKAINWLFITNAILKYVSISNWEETLRESTITLRDIFNNVYSKELATYLIAYTEDLKEFRRTMDTVKDIQGNLWCEKDSNYTFSYNGISSLL